MRKNKWIQKLYFVFNVLDIGGVILVLVLLIPSLNRGEIGVSTVITAVNLIGQLVGPMDSYLDNLDSMWEALGKMDKLKKIFDWSDPQEDGKIRLADDWQEIAFKDVAFHYRDTSSDAINGLNLSIRKGERVGICGAKGAGKSTLGKLLLGLYTPHSGSIMIDNIPIQEFTRNSFTRVFGAVQQDSTILKGTIRDNLTYGNPTVDEVKLVEACKTAGIYEFIQGLEKGFDTDAGLNGRKLSGGQRQCISIARMLIRDPDVIILDEATSALDNESERMVQRALNKIGGEKTIISIAHRLTTLKRCDRIIVLGKGGKILEEGNHASLLEKGGEYARLWNAGMEDE